MNALNTNKLNQNGNNSLVIKKYDINESHEKLYFQIDL